MRFLFLTIILFLSVSPSFSQDDSKLFTNKSYTEKWLKDNHIPALGIGYIKDGKIREVTVYGKNDKGRPLPKNTLFDVSSLTMPVTAYISLELINEGKWDLDQPIVKYYADPDVRTDPRCYELTMNNILSHRSGFPNHRKDMPDGKLVFQFAPGQKYQYSSEGYEYLRHMIERRFHESLTNYAGQLLFRPLQMKDSHFYDDSTVKQSLVAKRFMSDGTQYRGKIDTSENAATGLLTSVEDYCKFMIYIMDSAGFSPDLYHAMIEKKVLIKPHQYSGLGWRIDENVGNGEDALVSDGDDEGIHTIAIILPKSKEGLVIFTDSDNGKKVYIPAITHYLGKAGQEIIGIETK